MASLRELERLLAKLDLDMLEMKRHYPDAAQFMREFDGHARYFLSHAIGQGHAWADSEIRRLLDKHGFLAPSSEMERDQ